MSQTYICKIDNLEFRWISQLAVHLKRNYKLTTKEYYDIHIKPPNGGICKYCGSSTKFDGISDGYRVYCSNKCRGKYLSEHPELQVEMASKASHTKSLKYGDPNYNNQIKKIDTCFKKYGTSSYTKTAEYREKCKNTCLEKYGVEHYTRLDSTKEKCKNTCLEKYGVEHVLQAPDIRNRITNTVISKYGGYTYASKELNSKVKNTMVKLYGTESPLKNRDILDKVQTTNILRYGGKSPTKSKSVIDKIKQTNLTRYGVDNTFNLDTTRKTFLSRYGVINPSQIPEIQEKIQHTCLEKYGNKTFFGSKYATEKIRDTCLEKYGVENVMQCRELYKSFLIKINRAYRLKQYTTKFGDVITYQSIPELEFIMLCEKNNIKIINGPCIKYVLNGVNRIYYSDFLIEQNDNYRIVEVKRKHAWWYADLRDGIIKAKSNAAIKYSKLNGLLPYKIIFENRI